MPKKIFESYQLCVINEEGTEQKMRGMVLLFLFFFSGMKHTELNTDLIICPLFLWTPNSFLNIELAIDEEIIS